MSLLRCCLVLLCIASIAACSSSSGEKDATPDVCDEYARTLCARKQACAPGLFEINYAALQQCEDEQTAECKSRRDAESSGLSEEILAECRTELAEASCVTVMDPELGRCRARGTRPDDGACLYDEQCAGGNCYRELNSNLCGTCRSLGQEGDACSPDDDDGALCGPGLQCDGVPGTCRPAPISLEGETCDPSTFRRCASSLYCNAQYTCVPLLPADAPCVDLAECDFMQGLSCDLSVGRCREFPIKGAGESCFPPPNGVAVCGPGLACGADFICVPYLGLGEACAPSSICGPGLGCAASGTCVALSDLTCAGGTTDPGDPGGGGGGGASFSMDIPHATIALDCTAETATLTYVARYRNGLAIPQEARVDLVTASLSGGLDLDFTVSPGTSGEVAPQTAIPVTHTGSRTITAAACEACNQPATLTVVVSVDETSSTYVTEASVACAL